MKLYVGYHPSGTVLQAIDQTLKNNGNALQVFLGNSTCFYSKIIPDKEAEIIKQKIVENDIFLIAHSPYIINCCRDLRGTPALDRYIRDLCNVAKIGGRSSVLHMGKNVKELNQTDKESYKVFANNIRYILERKPTEIPVLLENMAGTGTSIGCKMNEWKEFWDEFTDEEKKEIYWCVDTAHLFGCGEFDLSQRREVTRFCEEFSQNIGWNRLLCFHFNGSLVNCGTKKDRHADIGEEYCGKICSKGLRHLARIAFLTGKPMICEVPCDQYSPNFQIQTIRNWCENVCEKN